MRSSPAQTKNNIEQIRKINNLGKTGIIEGNATADAIVGCLTTHGGQQYVEASMVTLL
jgi:hypothetical protein